MKMNVMFRTGIWRSLAIRSVWYAECVILFNVVFNCLLFEIVFFIDTLVKQIHSSSSISKERTLEIHEELCICFIDWPKAFDRVNWTKLMQILKISGIDWRESRLISKLYMDQRVKVRLDRGETRSVQIGRGFRQGCCLSITLFSL